MFDIQQLHNTAPFALSADEKTRLLQGALGDLVRHHYDACPEYQIILDKLGFDPANDSDVASIPSLPVRLFKHYALSSVPEGDIFKTMTSSGTSGQQVSKIFLDRSTASAQTKVLSRIVGDFIGGKRLPMLVIDAASTVKDRRNFSARGAGILGFSMFGRNVTYALDDDMRLDLKTVDAFLEKWAGQPILVFGFTFMVFQSLIEELAAMGKTLDLEQAVLIHGGGWKKLEDRAVDNAQFKAMLQERTGIARVHNYYGMVEQTGSIFMECEQGHLHCSIYSDIIIRKPDFSVANFGEQGLVELISLLPGSYPGHVLITEDMGTLLGEDDCTCGRKGRYFTIHGRAQNAEMRGCSDTFAGV